MKDIYSVAVFVATLAAFSLGQSPQVKIPTECPQIDPIDTTIHLAHQDCTKFYMCLRGQKIEMICPFMDKMKNRLHFNPELQVCDWPNHAGCKGNTGPSRPSTITDPPTTTTRPTTTTTRPTTTTTRPTTTTTRPTTTTTRPTTTTTRPTTTTTERTTTTSKPPRLPDYCPANTGGQTIKVQHNTICNYFYLCTDGKKVLQSCRAGNVFDPILHVCNFPSNVNCRGSKIMPPLIPLISKCPSKGVGKTITLPHECQCDRYYECYNGDMILKKCSLGLHYDYIRGLCHLPSIVKCVQSISPTSPSTIVGYEECSIENEGTKYEHKASCATYYECVNKRMILKYCAPGLYFNSILQICDYPDKECTISNTAFPPIINERTIPSYNEQSGCVGDCPWEDPSNYTVLLPNKDCHKFCMCSNGIAYEQSCPDTLRYDYLRKVCDYPRKVQCWKPPQRVVKTDRGRIPSDEYQNVGKENDWVNYVRDDNDAEMKENKAAYLEPVFLNA